MITKEQREEFETYARPLVRFINENANPHTVIIIDCDSARIFSGECGIPIKDYIKD